VGRHEIGFEIVLRLQVPPGLPWASRPDAGARLLPLSGTLTDPQVGAVVATLCRARWLRPDADLTTTLSELVEATRHDGRACWRLAGGLRLRVGGAVLAPGHGCAVGHWRSWRAPAAGEAYHPDWGEPPYWVESTGGGLRIHVDRRHAARHGGMVVDLGGADLRAGLAAVEVALRGAAGRVDRWVRGHAPARLAAPVAAAFALDVGLDPEPGPALAPPPVALAIGCMPDWSGRPPSWLPNRPARSGWIRLHAGMPDLDVAHAVWALLRDNGVEASLDLPAGLSALVAAQSRPDLFRPDLTGGLLFEVDSAEWLHPDCCCSVREWRWLREDLDKPDVDIMWGHGPAVRVTATGGGPFRVVDPYGLTRAVVERADLAGLLAAIPVALAGAAIRVRQWLTGQGLPGVAGPVAALFATAVSLAPA
jgi:hypothetical protein